MSKKESKVVVYTTIFGAGRDTLRNPLCSSHSTNHSVEYVAYLDREFTSSSPNKLSPFWECRKPIFRIDEPRRCSRMHKILPHRLFRYADYSLWLDGCLQLNNCNIDILINKYLSNHDICVFRHRSRICIEEELSACIEQKKDEPLIMRSQVDNYFKQGYPKNGGLIETTAVLRRHTKTIKELNENWWKEIETWSCRDQLSFNYVAWKLGTKYNTFRGSNMDSSYFHWHKHNKR